MKKFVRLHCNSCARSAASTSRRKPTKKRSLLRLKRYQRSPENCSTPFRPTLRRGIGRRKLPRQGLERLRGFPAERLEYPSMEQSPCTQEAVTAVASRLKSKAISRKS